MRRMAGVAFGACLTLSACPSDPLSGLRFACDPDGPNTCLTGYVCEAVSGHSYKGVCTPAGEVTDPGPACAEDCPGVKCPTGYVRIPSGQFTMGSPGSEPGRYSDEDQHQVTISKGFCLKATEVTQGEWEAVMGNNPSYFSSCGGTCPVEQVSWWDAVAYCNQLSQNEGLQQCYGLTGCSGTPGAGDFECTGVTFVGLSCMGYRLPTESEWEYAARAGTTGGTYNGTSTLTGCETSNAVLNPIAWFCGNSGDKTHAVKGKQANAWGLYDMLGNVWEWCWDWYGKYPGTVTDPTGAATGSLRVGRGGCWNSFAVNVRAAFRNSSDPGLRYGRRGFRPARSSP